MKKLRSLPGCKKAARRKVPLRAARRAVLFGFVRDAQAIFSTMRFTALGLRLSSVTTLARWPTRA